MSFTGISYDTGSYRQSLRESMGPGDYLLGTPLPDTSFVVVSPQLADAESDLFNLSRPLTDDVCMPGKQYGPGIGPYPAPASAPRLPDSRTTEIDYLVPENTRVSNPPSTMRSTGVNRFGYPLQDPQRHAISPLARAASDHMMARDNHRPCIATPFDPSAALPPPAPEDVPAPDYHYDPVPMIPQVVVREPPKTFTFLF